MKRNIFICLLLSFFTSLVYAQKKYEKMEIKGYTLASASYAEIEPLIKKMLSSEGTVGFVKARNKVLVYDTPTVHKKVAQLFSQATRPAVNIRVSIDYLNVKTWHDFGPQY